jgi:hypothetical protein
MLMTVIDGNGVSQAVIVSTQEAITNKSGSITATGVAQDAAVANALRSGCRFQNVGSNPMYFNDLEAAAVGEGSFIVGVGEYWPPVGYPVSTGAISVLGTVGDAFTGREW